MIRKGYILDGDYHYYFSTKEWTELVVSCIVSASISIFCNLLVISLQFFMLWYHYGAANRLTLRLIVTACFCNMIYCTLEMVTTIISSTNHSCRALIYLIVSFDTISSMSLAMVGVNLVMIFIFKISRSIKSEIAYYIVMLVSGIVVAIIPLQYGHKKTPTHVKNVTCWYHFYFEDRFDNVFNWMWYYGWTMFSVALAAVCAIISIRYVIKNQKNLVGVLNMFGQEEREEVTRTDFFRRYSASNTNVFLKIARRCVCYPLVPLFSKIWGVAIAIASSRNKDIPFAIFVVDRVFTCLSGFMIACIYFSDPTVKNLIKETMDSIKKKYVYDYYCIKYQPGFSQDGSAMNEKYFQELQIISLDKEAGSTAEYIKRIKNYNIRDQENSSSDTSLSDGNLQHPLEIPDTHTAIPIIEPPSVEFDVVRGEHIDMSSKAQRDRCFSLIALTSADGQIVIPKDSITAKHKKKCPMFSFRTDNISTIPMKRIACISGLNTKGRNVSMPEDEYACHTEFVETMVTFRNPKTAKFIHWCLVTVFRVKPLNIEDDTDMVESNHHQKGKRVFRDFTDSSNPQTPALDTCSRVSTSPIECSNKMNTQPSISEESLQADTYYDDNNASADIGNSSIKNNCPTIYILPGETSSPVSINTKAKRPGVHRSLSINIASLHRQKLKIDSPPASTRSKSSLSATQKIVASFGLRKLLDKSLAFSSSVKRSSISLQSKNNSIQSKEEGEEMEERKKTDAEVENQDLENKTTDVPTISPATMDELEFAIELSPRPISQYQRVFNKSKKETLTRYDIKEPTQKKIDRDKALDNDDTSSFGVSTKSDNIPKHPISKKTTNDSFKDISTSLNYITNWQLDDSNSRERIDATLEHWNLEQQLQDQVKNSQSLN